MNRYTTDNSFNKKNVLINKIYKVFSISLGTL